MPKYPSTPNSHAIRRTLDKRQQRLALWEEAKVQVCLTGAWPIEGPAPEFLIMDTFDDLCKRHGCRKAQTKAEKTVVDNDFTRPLFPEDKYDDIYLSRTKDKQTLQKMIKRRSARDAKKKYPAPTDVIRRMAEENQLYADLARRFRLPGYIRAPKGHKVDSLGDWTSDEELLRQIFVSQVERELDRRSGKSIRGPRPGWICSLPPEAPLSVGMFDTYKHLLDLKRQYKPQRKVKPLVPPKLK